MEKTLHEDFILFNLFVTLLASPNYRNLNNAFAISQFRKNYFGSIQK